MIELSAPTLRYLRDERPRPNRCWRPCRNGEGAVTESLVFLWPVTDQLWVIDERRPL